MQTKLRSQNLTEITTIETSIQNICTQLSLLYGRENKETEDYHAQRIRTNPKAFYTYANKFRKIKSKIGPLAHTDEQGETTFESGPKKMADILSSQYQSVFTTPRQ